MKKSIKVFVLLLFTLSYFYAKADTYEQIEDLSNTWFYNDENVSLPYVKGNNIHPRAVHFELNLKRYSDNYLSIKHPHSGVIFIDGQVFKVAERNTNFIFKIDSLQDLFPTGKVLITYFSEKGDYDRLQTAISAVTFSFSNNILNDATILRAKYERSAQIIILLIILSFFAVALNTNRKAFQDFYSFEEALVGRIRDDSVYKLKLFSQNNLAIFLFHASIISFLIVLLSRYSNSLFSFEKYLSGSDFINWFVLTIVVFIAFFVKYFIIKYIGELFDLGSSANYYFFEFMRLSMTYFLLLLAVASVVIISFPYLAGSVARICINTTFFFMMLRLVFLFFRIGKVSGFKNVHLFSYLCTTETLPIIVGMRYFLT